MDLFPVAQSLLPILNSQFSTHLPPPILSEPPKVQPLPSSAICHLTFILLLKKQENSFEQKNELTTFTMVTGLFPLHIHLSGRYRTGNNSSAIIRFKMMNLIIPFHSTIHQFIHLTHIIHESIIKLKEATAR